MVVGVGITLAALLFVGTAGLLYLRWATMSEPRCVLIVDASVALRGAAVTVDGVGLPQPHVGTIGVGERFSLPFYLNYGTYSVAVAMPDQEPFVSAEVTLTREEPGRRLDLTKVAPPPPPSPSSPGTAPSTVPDAPWMPEATRGLPSLTPPPAPPRGGSGFSP